MIKYAKQYADWLAGQYNAGEIGAVRYHLGLHSPLLAAQLAVLMVGNVSYQLETIADNIAPRKGE